jgi:LDH2 family malate/lactate/ureidoglycolate dehydrogenase
LVKIIQQIRSTLPNLPPWGAHAPGIGNNPLVIAVPATNTSDSV